MKVETSVREIQRSSSFEEKTMGLAVGSEAFVFNVLRKDLYSDPIGSLIREYTVNAQDEHRKHNKADVPIFINVPTHLTPELHIRDYAGGLTEEQVYHFFGNYGASDKRDSNVAVGFFGLGCKSAFAYTDSYIVKSYKDGTLHTFNVYIDETEIGKVAKLSSEPTTEPNGVLVIVPVKTYDIPTFQQKVLSTVKHFKTQPVLEGLTEVPEDDTPEAWVEGEDWKVMGRGNATLVMGEIAYPIQTSAINGLERWEYNLLTSIGLVLNADIGDVQVTASREALQMSEKTVSCIRARLTAVRSAISDKVQSLFDATTNLIEATRLWNELFMGNGGLRFIRESLVKPKWNGQEIDSSYIYLNSPHTIRTYSLRRNKIEGGTSSNIQVTANTLVFFDDTDKTQVNYKRRARTLLDADPNKEIYIIDTPDKKALEEFLGMPVKRLPSLNAVIPTKAKATNTGGGTVNTEQRAKHTSKAFVLNRQKLSNLGQYSLASELWDVKEVSNLKGCVYVPIKRFVPQGVRRVYDLSCLKYVLALAEKAGIDTNIPIYGIKEGATVDLTDMVRFDVWLNNEIQNNKTLLEREAKALGLKFANIVDASYLDPQFLPQQSVAKEYVDLYHNTKQEVREHESAIFQYSTVTVEADETLRKLSSNFFEAYPMLKLVPNYYYKDTVVLEYIAEAGV